MFSRLRVQGNGISVILIVFLKLCLTIHVVSGQVNSHSYASLIYIIVILYIHTVIYIKQLHIILDILDLTGLYEI